MAGSPNAFAISTNGHARNSNGFVQEDEGGARAPKRARLSEDAIASIQTQCALAESSLEVDHMILDYTAYQTINACFASRNTSHQRVSSLSLSNSLAMSDSFLSIFRARHPLYEPDAELRLRILLLRLTTLFTQRLTSNPTTPSSHALFNLREEDQERARTWISSKDRIPSARFDTTKLDSQLPIAPRELEHNRAHVLEELGIPAEDEDYEDAFYGTASCISLLEMLPLFMQVSAARNAMNSSNLTERWMSLACEFMLQAVLEQYLVIGARGSDAVDEAFAWGRKEREEDEMEADAVDRSMDRDTLEVNQMFEDEVYAAEVDGWTSAKASFLDELLSTSKKPYTSSSPGSEHDVSAHFETIAAKYPIDTFESALLKFLEALHQSIPEPVLVQLENGQLDGMTKQETRDFLAECGFHTARFFDAPVGFKAAE